MKKNQNTSKPLSKAKEAKKILYSLDGKGVPFSYIKKVYEGSYLPPITPELITKWWHIIRKEKGLE